MADGADPKPSDDQKNNLTEAEALLFNLNALYKKFTEFKEYYTVCKEKTEITAPAAIDRFDSYLQSIVGTLINTKGSPNINRTIKHALENLAGLLGTNTP